jgi:hypothetical protein
VLRLEDIRSASQCNSNPLHSNPLHSVNHQVEHIAVRWSGFGAARFREVYWACFHAAEDGAQTISAFVHVPGASVPMRGVSFLLAMPQRSRICFGTALPAFGPLQFAESLILRSLCSAPERRVSGKSAWLSHGGSHFCATV